MILFSSTLSLPSSLAVIATLALCLQLSAPVTVSEGFIAISPSTSTAYDTATPTQHHHAVKHHFVFDRISRSSLVRSCSSSNEIGERTHEQKRTNVRRNILTQPLLATTGFVFGNVCCFSEPAAATSLQGLNQELVQARSQMNAIPDLIKREQWDAVRAILVTPPLSDLWTKSKRSKALLSEYADVVGENPAGDELAVLEAKEEVLSHLRYLDMAVYNNVFNPIKSEGTTGATQQLIRSYFDDPTNEFKSSIAALDELINLGKL